MEHEVLYRPEHALLRVRLAPGEALVAEAGAMVSMSQGIELEPAVRGGFLQALRRGLGGESFFVNTFRAPQGGEVTLAPPLPGDITVWELEGTLYAQSRAYLASTAEVEVDSKWAGARGFFAGEGLFLLRLSGRGTVFLTSYGAIHAVELGPGERYVVDTGHLVAFPEGVEWHVRRVGGLKSMLFSGEGLVCELRGPGRVLLQTRSGIGFLSWLIPLLPRRG